jgi:hypothetical protein
MGFYKRLPKAKNNAGVAQWYSACLACLRPYIHSLTLYKLFKLTKYTLNVDSIHKQKPLRSFFLCEIVLLSCITMDLFYQMHLGVHILDLS